MVLHNSRMSSRNSLRVLGGSRFLVIQISSVAQLCSTLCDPMDHSTPCFPGHHQLPELTQTHVHHELLVMPSNPLILSHPFSACPQSFPASGSFPVRQLFTSGGQSIVASASAISLSNEYSKLISFRMDWLDLLAVQGTLKSSPTPQFKSINSLVLSFLYSPTLTSIHDLWKNHSLDEMDLCWQSNVSAF